MNCQAHKNISECHKYSDECLWFEIPKMCNQRPEEVIKRKVKTAFIPDEVPPKKTDLSDLSEESESENAKGWFSWFFKSSEPQKKEQKETNEINSKSIQAKKTTQINKLSDWKQAMLRLQDVNDWVLDKSSIFATDDITLVLYASKKEHTKAIMKASFLDSGRIINEANYIRDLTLRGKSLFGIKNGFPKIYDINSRFPLVINGKEANIGYYVMERLGPSLHKIAESSDTFQRYKHSTPIFGGFKVSQVALIAQNLIKRLQIMHTPSGSLGLTHNDIKPDNVLINIPDNSVYLIDLDVASAISSIVSKYKTKNVQGSYEFSGTDALLKFQPCPKSDLDSLGQLLIWCASGDLPWKTDKKELDKLAIEKDSWRKQPYKNRPGLGPLKDSAPFEKYFKYVESLSIYSRAISEDDKVDYDYMYYLFDNIADKKVSFTLS